jgi:hypothetical protein
MVRAGGKGSFLQLTRREKDGTLVPKRDAQSENGGDDPDDSAQESQPDFITQVCCSLAVTCASLKLTRHGVGAVSIAICAEICR